MKRQMDHSIILPDHELTRDDDKEEVIEPGQRHEQKQQHVMNETYHIDDNIDRHDEKKYTTINRKQGIHDDDKTNEQSESSHEVAKEQ
jgi:hypothetical protein